MAVFLDGDPKYLYSIFLQTCDPTDDARLQAGKDWLAAFYRRNCVIPKTISCPTAFTSYPGGNTDFAHSSLVSPRLKALIETHQTDEDGWQLFR